jgi:predicted chitinase
MLLEGNKHRRRGEGGMKLCARTNLRNVTICESMVVEDDLMRLEAPAVGSTIWTDR